MIMQQKDNADIVAREGDNVTLACDAKGHPRPQVVWRREDKEDILVNGRKGIMFKYFKAFIMFYKLRLKIFCHEN